MLRGSASALNRSLLKRKFPWRVIPLVRCPKNRHKHNFVNFEWGQLGYKKIVPSFWSESRTAMFSLWPRSQKQHSRHRWQMQWQWFEQCSPIQHMTSLPLYPLKQKWKSTQYHVANYPDYNVIHNINMVIYCCHSNWVYSHNTKYLLQCRCRKSFDQTKEKLSSLSRS